MKQINLILHLCQTILKESSNDDSDVDLRREISGDEEGVVDDPLTSDDSSGYVTPPQTTGISRVSFTDKFRSIFQAFHYERNHDRTSCASELSATSTRSSSKYLSVIVVFVAILVTIIWLFEL